MPRCFAATVYCSHHIARVPHVRNAGSPGVHGLASDRSAGLVVLHGEAVNMLSWLKSLFGIAPRRDVSRLETDSDSLDRLTEVVDLSGGPLKPGHRRAALRDRRLLPKPSAPPIRFGKRPANPWFSTRDAARWFSATFLTRNRRLRDLLPDEAQLKRLGLPVWRDERDLAAALGISLGQLRHFSIHRERERHPHYVAFSRPKRGGGERIILAPKRRLKALQRQMLAAVVGKLPVSEHAHGFRRGRSVRSGAEPHVGKACVVHLDLKDFFPTVTFPRVRGFFIACGYGYGVATVLAMLTTEARRQPVAVEGVVYHVPVGPRHAVQGAPTSPALCNALVLKLDRRLAGLARKFGLAYTRYADDLSFSGELDSGATGRFLRAADAIIRAEGFEANAAKTRVMRRGGRQAVTNVTVNDTLGLSRRERRRLRAAGHALKKRDAAGAPDSVAEARWHGQVAYVAMLNPAQAEKLRAGFGAQP